MRIVSWNIRSRSSIAETEGCWQLLSHELGADVALLQECVPAAGLADSGRLVYREIGGMRPWGLGGCNAEWTVAEPVDVEVQNGAAVVAQVANSAGRGSITVISIYGLLERALGTQYSVTGLHRTLSDLTEVLESPQHRGRVVLGGDLNASLQWDEQQRFATHRILFERLEAFGLSAVVPLDGGIQTYRHNQGDYPWQLDHVFVSKELSGDASWRVLDTTEIRLLSDHNPIVVDQEVGN